MPSTYTLNNGIELIGTGEQSGTWGDTTNTNLQLIDTALDGQVTVTLASAGTSGSPNALAISDGSSSDGRNRMVIFNDGADLGATAYVQLTPNDAEKIVYIRNALSGSRSIIVFQGTYSASNDYEIPAGTTAVIYFNGGGAGAVAANVFNNAYFDSLRLGGVSVTAIIDDDTMATAAATNIPTAESVKAYVDAQVGANNELSEVLANGNTTGGTDIAVSAGDDITFGDNSKAIFGAGSDLQIFHDGSNSYIKDAGTGTLRIQSSSSILLEGVNGDNFLEGVENGAVYISYDGSTKLATTSTGVDVTGTVTADGLTVDNGGGTFTGLLPTLDLMEADTANLNTRLQNQVGDFSIRTLSDNKATITNRFAIDHATGDISFYEDTGTTAKFFWDASAESLGIGGAPTAGYALDVVTAGNTILGLTSADGSYAELRFGDASDKSRGSIQYTSSDEMVFTRGNMAEAMRTTSAGVDVTGTVTADGLVLDQTTNTITTGSTDGSDNRRLFVCGGGSASVNTGGNISVYGNEYSGSGGNVVISAGDALTGGAVDGDIKLLTGPSRQRLTVDQNGDISFYEDTGTTAKLFWDASTERLGIGNAAPTTTLDVTGTVTADGLVTDTTNGVKINTGAVVEASWTHADVTGTSTINVGRNSTWGGNLIIQTDTKNRANFASNGDISFYEDTGTTPKMVWSASAESLGIGTSSPSAPLSVRTSSGYLSQDIIGDATYGAVSLRFRNAGNTATTVFHNYDSGEYKFGTIGSEPVVINTVNAERMRIDASGNVGIGTSSPAANLDVAQFGGTPTIRITNLDGTMSSTQDIGKVEFFNSDATTPGPRVASYILSQSANTSGGGDLQFATSPNGGTVVERMRLDSLGNMLVGTTTANPAGSANVEGSQINSIGAQFSRDAGPALYVNRKTSDGSLVEFRKDGTTVGSIGVQGSKTYIGTGDAGLLFDNTNNRIDPCWPTNTGSTTNGTLDLGGAATRFKDLYLSGGVYLGGTGAANLLDDVEEGTWTPALYSGPSGVSYNTREGYYFKVGSIVFVRFYINFTCTGGAGNDVRGTGLPYVQNTTGVSWLAAGSIGGNYNNSTGARNVVLEGTNNIFKASNDSTLSSTGTKTFEGTFVYATTS